MLSGDLVLFIFGVFLWVFNALHIRAGSNQVVSGDSKRERPCLGGKLLNGCSDGLCVKLSSGIAQKQLAKTMYSSSSLLNI